MTEDGNRPVIDVTQDAAPVIAEAGGAPVLLVPAEDVLALAVALPLPTHARRMAALPFAIEDRLAAPLDATHLALGERLADGRYLAVAVAHDRMAAWVAAADAMGCGHLPLVPDALLLPVPDEGWAVAIAGPRALVRTADGTGFAMPTALLETIGHPILTVPSTVTSPPVDLRQGRHAPPRAPSPWRRLALVAGCGLAAHALIAAADTLALSRIAAHWRGAVATRLALAPDADLETAALARLPVATAPPGRFVPLLSRAATALAGRPGLAVRAIGYDGGALTLDLSGDVAAATTALAAAGLSPRRAGDRIILS